MDFLDPKIESYATDHTSNEPAVLAKLNRETNAKVLMPRMLSGHLQGRVLSMLSNMIKPKNILEIGTYTGYSALCLCEGLTEGGMLHTIDINEELEKMVRAYFEEAGVSKKINYHIGNAVEIIPSIKETFDLVFIDADKENYSNYFDLVIDKVRKDGIIIADNVLWSGKVLEDIPSSDYDTMGIKNYNEKVMKDPRVENVILPVRDGLMIARKL